ncbi:MAG: hypothetical protein DMF95_25400 [Acidobacteria bacterium]|nr:MAG: hypothetical protein DMF95_25400 [Acidobacteriota bacterium]
MNRRAASQGQPQSARRTFWPGPGIARVVRGAFAFMNADSDIRDRARPRRDRDEALESAAISNVVTTTPLRMI